MSSTTAPQGALTTNRSQLAGHELRLLLQAVVQFIVEFSLCILWYWQMLCGNRAGGRIGTIFISWFWVFMCGFKPLLYLTINRTIRGRMLQLWRFKLENNGIASAFSRIKPGRSNKNNNDLEMEPQKMRNIRTINVLTSIH